MVVTPTAEENLNELIASNDLPADTRERVRSLLEPLVDFPAMGPSLDGRWEGFRYLLGPWPCMLLVYAFDEERDLVALVTVQDARRSSAATAFR